MKKRDEEIRFSDWQEMYQCLCNGVELYNMETGAFVFQYNDAGALCMYNLSTEYVKEIAARAEEDDECWSAYLGTGGNILDDPNNEEYRYSKDSDKQAMYLMPSYDYCQDNYAHSGWISTETYYMRIQKQYNKEDLIQTSDITIRAEGGKKFTFSKEDYEVIAAYVRVKDRHDYAVDVLMNGITGQYPDLANVEEYLISDEEKVDKFAMELDDKINGDTGEIEYNLAEKWIAKESPAYYRVISNKGTEDEQQDDVVISVSQAEAIQAGKWHGDLVTLMNTTISTEYISELQYCKPFSIEN